MQKLIYVIVGIVLTIAFIWSYPRVVGQKAITSAVPSLQEEENPLKIDSGSSSLESEINESKVLTDKSQIKNIQESCNAPVGKSEELMTIYGAPAVKGEILIFLEMPRGMNPYNVLDSIKELRQQVKANNGVIVREVPEMLMFTAYFCGEWNNSRFETLKAIFEKNSYVSSVSPNFKASLF